MIINIKSIFGVACCEHVDQNLYQKFSFLQKFIAKYKIQFHKQVIEFTSNVCLVMEPRNKAEEGSSYQTSFGVNRLMLAVLTILYVHTCIQHYVYQLFNLSVEQLACQYSVEQ